jgi:hypothetical protein
MGTTCLALYGYSDFAPTLGYATLKSYLKLIMLVPNTNHSRGKGKLKGYTIDFMLGENRSEYAKIVLHLVKQFVNIFNTVDRKLDTELEVAGTWNNMTFAGTADLIEYHDNGDITIWDIKHYNSISDKDFNMFDIQTDIYASLFEDTTGNTVTHTGIILPIQGRLERKRN